MKLKVYLAHINMTLRDFSKLVEYDYNHLSTIMNGKVRPGKHLAQVVKEITDGEVDLLKDAPPKKMRRICEEK